MSTYEMVIGIEVHTQLNTKSKAWSACSVDAHAMENTKVCEVSMGHPGTLPVLNKKVLEYAAKLGLATNCEINEVSFFDRKNYFYPDLPKGYQITQFEKPIAVNGKINIDLKGKETKTIGIERIQIEEDTGKSIHEGEASLINLNRSGTPLLEIVGMPDIRSAEEAVAYLKQLHSIITYLEISNGNLQEGNFRCDINISLMPKGSKEYGTRTEIKNLNSFKSVEKAIEVEQKRQEAILKAGNKVIQQTLGFDFDTGIITALRTKSDAHDYRYFPEPDLLPLHISQLELNKWREELPELPLVKQKRFVESYNIPLYDAEVLTTNKILAAYFEEAVSLFKGEPKKVSNWMMTELLGLLKEFSIGVEKSPVPANEIASLLNFVEDGTISGKMAKEVFQHMFDENKSAAATIEKLGLKQISDPNELTDIISNILDNNTKQLTDYLNGRDKLYGFFVGQIMKETKGQANPGITNKILKELLNSKKGK